MENAHSVSGTTSPQSTVRRGKQDSVESVLLSATATALNKKKNTISRQKVNVKRQQLAEASGNFQPAAALRQCQEFCWCHRSLHTHKSAAFQAKVKLHSQNYSNNCRHSELVERECSRRGYCRRKEVKMFQKYEKEI